MVDNLVKFKSNSQKKKDALLQAGAINQEAQKPVEQKPTEVGKRHISTPQEMDDVLRSCKKIGVIITNMEPEASLYCTPVLRLLREKYTEAKITVMHTGIANQSWEDILKLDDNIDFKAYQKIDQQTFDTVINPQFDLVLMLNFPATIQQGLMTRGVHAAQALGMLCQLVVPPVEAHSIAINITEESRTVGKDIADKIGGKYIVLAPTFSVPLDQNWQVPRLWEPANWMALLDLLTERNPDIHVVIIGTYDPFIPQDVELDRIHVIANNDIGVIAEVINGSEGVVTIDTAFAQIARALNKKIVSIHSGGPISWSAPVYDLFEDNATVIASVNIGDIEVDTVLEEVERLLLGK